MCPTLKELFSFIIIYFIKTGGLAVDRLRQHRPIGVVGHCGGVDRGCSESLRQLNYPVKLIVGISDEVAAGAVGVDLLNGRRPAVERVGDLLCSIRIGDRLPGRSAAEPLQFHVCGQAVEVGTPALQTIHTLFLDGDHRTGLLNICTRFLYPS